MRPVRSFPVKSPEKDTRNAFFACLLLPSHGQNDKGSQLESLLRLKTTQVQMLYLSPKQISAQLGISERTVRRWMCAGHIRAFRVGTKLWRADQRAVEEYLREGQYKRYRRELRLVRLRSLKRS